MPKWVCEALAGFYAWHADSVEIVHLCPVIPPKRLVEDWAIDSTNGLAGDDGKIVVVLVAELCHDAADCSERHAEANDGRFHTGFEFIRKRCERM